MHAGNTNEFNTLLFDVPLLTVGARSGLIVNCRAIAVVSTEYSPTSQFSCERSTAVNRYRVPNQTEGFRMGYTIEVNGVKHDVDAEGDTPLLWVLRDILNMTGTKFGCGIGQCGACTVHTNGSAARSCQLPLGVCPSNRSVKLLEGKLPRISGHVKDLS